MWSGVICNLISRVCDNMKCGTSKTRFLTSVEHVEIYINLIIQEKCICKFSILVVLIYVLGYIN